MGLSKIISRIKFLLAYKKDIESKSGSLKARQELVNRFNATKFFFQKRLELK